MNNLFLYGLIYDLIMNHIIISLIVYGESGEIIYETLEEISTQNGPLNHNSKSMSSCVSQ